MTTMTDLDYDVQYLSEMKALEDLEKKGGTPIQRSFEDAVVFLTGGTGFVGQQLIEKLLRSCSGIKKLYILIRDKRGKSLEDRLTRVLEDPVFDVLRRRYPQFELKIQAVSGDVSELRIGLNNEDYSTLTQEITHIFHVAATVNFDEHIKKAVLTNTRGTREMLYLAKECHNLKSMVHVSTAFSFCAGREDQDVYEKCYDVPLSPESLINLAETLDVGRLSDITPGLLGEFPNSYTFSKAAAEVMVANMAKDLPLCVIRPAIVVPSYREPFPGWINYGNVFGTSGLILGYGVGAIHTLFVDDTRNFDIVTVDFVNNLAIAASWETTQTKRKGDDPKIYTLSGLRRPLKWRESEKYTLDNCRFKYESPKMVGAVYSYNTNNIFMYRIYTLLLHFIPAILADIVLTIMGKKRIALKLYKKMYKLNIAQSYFLTNSWNFSDENTLTLFNKLSTDDKSIYQFDIATNDILRYTRLWWLGLRKYILKDGLKSDVGIKKHKVLIALNYIFAVVYAWVLYKFVMLMFSFLATVLSMACIYTSCK